LDIELHAPPWCSIVQPFSAMVTGAERRMIGAPLFADEGSDRLNWNPHDALAERGAHASLALVKANSCLVDGMSHDTRTPAILGCCEMSSQYVRQ
jgi:hypothetical protein